ncbi:MAG: inner-rane translocator [Anaerocolumna sp.]|jgi:simple sugar transport system permease protein|nr:inner-rane translocator [Anaerocolumna sp.]
MEQLSSILTGDFILLTLRLAIPIILAAIGETFCERSGVMNLGIEGMMLIGALSGVLGSFFSGEPWVGVVFAIIVGAGIGFIYALLCVRYKADQVVCGIGLNMLSLGFTTAMVHAVWNRDGMSGTVAQVENVSIPILKNIPLLGRLFEKQSPFLYLTLIIVAASWYFMYKTKIGLRLRAIGDHPQAAESVGINVTRYRYASVILCGILASIAGAYLSIVQNNLFVQNMVAGRGFMAIAANIFGGWNPVGSFLASLVFAFAQALRLNLADLNIPDQFIQMLPYGLTLIVLVGVAKKAKGPEALGKI